MIRTSNGRREPLRVHHVATFNDVAVSQLEQTASDDIAYRRASLFRESSAARYSCAIPAGYIHECGRLDRAASIIP